MNRFLVAAGATVTATTLVLGGTLPASATPRTTSPAKLVIRERIDFSGDTGNVRFTAEGPLCRSGVQEDEVVGQATISAQRDIHRFTIDSTYRCDDGSGSFLATKVIVVDSAPDGRSVSSGPIRFRGGTGAYSRLAATGIDSGRVGGDGLGAGAVLGVITRI